jgi:signal transduction histidine kinase
MVRLEKIYQSALKFLVPQTIEETYMTVVNEAMKLVNASHGSIFIPQGNEIIRVYTSTPFLYKIKARKGGVTENVIKTGSFRLLSGKKLEKNHPAFKEIRVGSDITIALNYGHITIGALSVLSKPNTNFGDEETAIMRVYAPLATLAIRNSLLQEDLRKALQTRDLFISMAAHELRTPLTSIYLYSELIYKKTLKKELPKEEHATTLLEEAKRMTRLVDELMNVAHIQQGRLRFKMKKCNLNEVIDTALRDFKQSHEGEIVFINKSGKNKNYISGDSDKLIQSLTNLMNNSDKYSDKNKKITVTLQRTGTTLNLKIKDSGKGIPKNELPHLFEQFYRSADEKGKNPGMGLGLFIVKNIVDKHQGKIEIDSKVGKGTTVTITLPVYKDAA